MAIFQWKQDIVQAETLCKEALDIDPDCDVAIATLAQLSLQQGKIEEAINWFERSAKLARTEAELINALTCELDHTSTVLSELTKIRRARESSSTGFPEKLPRVRRETEPDGFGYVGGMIGRETTSGSNGDVLEDTFNYEKCEGGCPVRVKGGKRTDARS